MTSAQALGPISARFKKRQTVLEGVAIGYRLGGQGGLENLFLMPCLSLCDNDNRDPSLDALLDLDGQVLVVDPETRHRVRFVVRLVTVSELKPHGLDYSLTLHGPDGERLVGFDKCASGQKPIWTRGDERGAAAYDHKHRLKTVRLYEYHDAATLLADFWKTVDAVLREKGVIS